MNTELLREDERESLNGWWPMVILLRQRLIEEREKNAELNGELNSLSAALADLEAELAEVRR